MLKRDLDKAWKWTPKKNNGGEVVLNVVPNDENQMEIEAEGNKIEE